MKSSEALSTVRGLLKTNAFKVLVNDVNGEPIQEGDCVFMWTGRAYQSAGHDAKVIFLKSDAFDSVTDANVAFSLIKKTRPLPETALNIASLDQRGDLLHCRDAVYSISGEKYSHNEEFRNTVCLEIAPDSTMETLNWNKLITDLCSTDGKRDFDYEKYMKQVLGYGLFGLNDRKEVYFFYGVRGNNGKSTLFNLIKHILGPYFYSASRSIVVKKGDDKFSLAQLQNKRFVAIPELEDKSNLNTENVKAITGKDTIKAEEKYKTEFNFTPTCKLFCNTNRLPVISSRDSQNALKQRIRILPNQLELKEGENMIRDFDDLLKKEAPGILFDLIKHAVDGYKNGIKTPKKVEKETRALFYAVDTVSEFLDSFKKDRDSHIKTSEALGLYEKWLAEVHFDQSTFKNTKAFASAIRERDMDIEIKKRSGCSQIIGIDFTRRIDISEDEPTHEPPSESKTEQTTTKSPHDGAYERLVKYSEQKTLVESGRKCGESLDKAAYRLRSELSQIAKTKAKSQYKTDKVETF